MTINEFRHLDSGEQFRTFKKGVEVGEYDDGFSIRKCRQVDDFYVEYVMDTTDNFNMYILCHRNTAWLDKYFKGQPSITIDELL